MSAVIKELKHCQNIFCGLQTLDDITYEMPNYEGFEKEWHDIIG